MSKATTDQKKNTQAKTLAPEAKTRKKRRKSKQKKAPEQIIPKGIIPVRISDATKEQFDLHSLAFGIPIRIVNKLQLLKFITTKDQNELLEHFQQIESESGDEIVFVKDPMNTYGTNFYLVVEPNDVHQLKVKYKLIAGPPSDDEEEEEGQLPAPATTLEVSDDDNTERLSALGWRCLGSSVEVDDLNWDRQSRPPISVVFERKTKHFGRPFRFQDGKSEQATIVNILPSVMRAPAATTKTGKPAPKSHQDGVTTTHEPSQNAATNTELKLFSQKALQYEAQVLAEEVVQKQLKQPRLAVFVISVLRLFEEAMIENEFFDPVTSDVATLRLKQQKQQEQQRLQDEQREADEQEQRPDEHEDTTSEQVAQPSPVDIANTDAPEIATDATPETQQVVPASVDDESVSTSA